MMNSYTVLVDAASQLVGSGTLEDWDMCTHQQLAGFVDSNASPLETARLAAHEHGYVPLEYTAEWYERHLVEIGHLRNLGRAFWAAFTVAERRSDMFEAVERGLDLLHLGNRLRRGGLVTDCLIAQAFEGIGVDSLRRIRKRLTPPLWRRLAREVVEIEADRERLRDILVRDARWEAAVDQTDEAEHDEEVLSTLGDDDDLDEETANMILEAMRELSETPGAFAALQEQNDARDLTLLRLLAVDSALRAYQAASGAMPKNLSFLSPGLLPEVPTDPHTNTEFVYRPSGNEFLLYSPGPSKHDTGGCFGHWTDVRCGRLDLCLDMNDIQPT